MSMTVKIGHHKIGAWAEIGQNRIWGDGGSKKLKKRRTSLMDDPLVNPNWHETGRIYLPYNFRIGFCQLNFYQKFPNIFGGENWDQSG
jgi:hypothetical protein